MGAPHSPLPPQGGGEKDGQKDGRKTGHDSEHNHASLIIEVRPIQTATSDTCSLSARVRQPLSERLIIIILYLLSIVNVFNIFHAFGKSYTLLP